MTWKMSANTSVLSEERRVDEEALIQPALSTCGRLKQLAPAQTNLVAGIIWLQCKIIANARAMILRTDTNDEQICYCESCSAVICNVVLVSPVTKPVATCKT
jgi:hypothetical protein